MSNVPATFVVQRIGQLMRETGENRSTSQIAKIIMEELSNYGLEDTFAVAYFPPKPLDVSAGPNWERRNDQPEIL